MPQSLAKGETTAEQQFAEDWHLFEQVENGALNYAWRIWEVYVPVVVLGRFGRVAEDVVVAHCERDGVPIVRRFSGGGAVVIGPGCLNFTVVLALQAHPDLLDVSRSFQLVLGDLVAALAIEGVSIAGGTDLVIDGRKVSGNAQRRGRRAVVHHGTLLYDFDAGLAARYLREPRRQPGYRAQRTHVEFIGRLPVPRDTLATRLGAALAAGVGGGPRCMHKGADVRAVSA